jgi:hypothetical protein
MATVTTMNMPSLVLSDVSSISPGKDCYQQGQQDVDKTVKPTSKYSSISFGSFPIEIRR